MKLRTAIIISGTIPIILVFTSSAVSSYLALLLTKDLIDHFSDQLFQSQLMFVRLITFSLNYQISKEMQKLVEMISVQNHFQSKVLSGLVNINPQYVNTNSNVELLYSNQENPDLTTLFLENKYAVSVWTQQNVTSQSQLSQVGQQVLSNISISNPLMRSYLYTFDKDALLKERRIQLNSQYIGLNAEGMLYENAQNTTYRKSQLQNCNTTGPNVIDIRCVSWFQRSLNYSSLYPYPISLTPPSPGKPLKLNSGVCQGLRNYNVTKQQDDLYLTYCAPVNVTTLSNYFSNFTNLVNQSYIVSPRSWITLYNSKSQTSQINYFYQDEINTNQNMQEAIDLNNTLNNKFSTWTQTTSLQSNLVDMLNTQDSLIIQQSYIRNGTKVMAMINPIIVYDKLPQYVGVKSYQPKGFNTNILYLQINFITDQFLQERAMQLIQQFNNYFLISSIIQLVFFIVSLFFAVHYTIQLNRLIEQPLVNITNFLNQMLEELKSNELFDIYNTFNLNVKDMLRSEEISELYKTLEQTFQLLIKTTDNFFNENPTNTLLRLYRNIKFFNQFRNNHAVGIIHNSIGIILMSEDHYFQALRHFSLSVLFAQYEIQEYFIQNGFSNEMIPFFCFHDEIIKKSLPSQPNRLTHVSSNQSRQKESSINNKVKTRKNNQKPKISTFLQTKIGSADIKNNFKIECQNQNTQDNQKLIDNLVSSSPLCISKNNSLQQPPVSEKQQQQQQNQEFMQLPFICEQDKLEDIHTSMVESNVDQEQNKQAQPQTINSHHSQGNQTINDSNETVINPKSSDQKLSSQKDQQKPQSEELNNLYLNVYYRKKNYAITLIQFQEYQQKNLKQIQSLYNIQFNFWREIKCLLKELIAIISYIKIQEHEVIELLTLISKCQLNLNKISHAKKILNECSTIGNTLQMHISLNSERQDQFDSNLFPKTVFEKSREGSRITLYNQQLGKQHQRYNKLRKSNTLSVGRETPVLIGKETLVNRKRNISRYTNLSSSNRNLNQKKQEIVSNHNDPPHSFKQSEKKQNNYDENTIKKVGVSKKLKNFWRKLTGFILRRQDPEDARTTQFTIISKQQENKNVECDTSNNEICKLELTFQNMRNFKYLQSNMNVGDHFLQTIRLAFSEYYVFTKKFSLATKIIIEEFENNFTMYSYLPFQMSEMLNKILQSSQIEDSSFQEMTAKYNLDISMRVNIAIGNIENSSNSCIDTLNLISNLVNQTFTKPNDQMSVNIYNNSQELVEVYMQLIKVSQIQSHISFFIQDIFKILQNSNNLVDNSFTDRIITPLNFQLNNTIYLQQQQDTTYIPTYNKSTQNFFPHSKRTLNYFKNKKQSNQSDHLQQMNSRQKSQDTILKWYDNMASNKQQSIKFYNKDSVKINNEEQTLPILFQKSKSQNSPKYNIFDDIQIQNHANNSIDLSQLPNIGIQDNYNDTKMIQDFSNLNFEIKESPIFQNDYSFISQKYTQNNKNLSNSECYVSNNNIQKESGIIIKERKENFTIQERLRTFKCQELEGDLDDLEKQLLLDEDEDGQSRNEYIFHISVRKAILQFYQSQYPLQQLFNNRLQQQQIRLLNRYIQKSENTFFERFQKRMVHKNYIIYITNRFYIQKNTLFFKLVECLFSLNITLIILSFSRGDNFIQLLDEATYQYEGKQLIKIFSTIQSVETFLNNQRSNITKHIYPTYVQNF